MKNAILFVLVSFQISTAWGARITSSSSFEFFGGMTFQNFDYKEDLTPPSKSTENASYPSINLQLLYRWASLSFLKFKFEGSSAISSNYEGSTLNSGTPVTATNPLKLYRTEALLNLELAPHLALVTGLGYRYWDRFLSGGSGYREIYTWTYLPVGMSWSFAQGNGWDLAVEPLLLPMVSGDIKVITSETVSGGDDSTMTLGSKTGFRLSMPFRFLLGSMTAAVVPFYEKTALGQSNLVPNATLSPTAGTGIYEPASETQIMGADFLVGFSF